MGKQYLCIVFGLACTSYMLKGDMTINKSEEKSTFSLMSNAFTHNGNIPAKYSCDGEDISPQLTWRNAPSETKSFALIVDDPDAPKARPWVHWVLFNIDPSVTTLPEGTKTTHFVNGTTDFGHKKYGGPCPPSGTHRYFFKLYALNKKLDLAEGSTKEQALKAMEGHILAQTELIGLYRRQK